MSRYRAQEVCPWNERFPARLAAEAPERGAGADYRSVAWSGDRPDDPVLLSLEGPDLIEFTRRVLAMSGKEYRRGFAASPLSRPGRKGMLRNLCVALGNYGATSPEAAARARSVSERAARDSSELVREHAAWGLEAID